LSGVLSIVIVIKYQNLGRILKTNIGNSVEKCILLIVGAHVKRKKSNDMKLPIK
jgi:hypothetical protein